MVWSSSLAWPSNHLRPKLPGWRPNKHISCTVARLAFQARLCLQTSIFRNRLESRLFVNRLDLVSFFILFFLRAFFFIMCYFYIVEVVLRRKQYVGRTTSIAQSRHVQVIRVYTWRTKSAELLSLGLWSPGLDEMAFFPVRRLCLQRQSVQQLGGMDRSSRSVPEVSLPGEHFNIWLLCFRVCGTLVYRVPGSANISWWGLPPLYIRLALLN